MKWWRRMSTYGIDPSLPPRLYVREALVNKIIIYIVTISVFSLGIIFFTRTFSSLSLHFRTAVGVFGGLSIAFFACRPIIPTSVFKLLFFVSALAQSLYLCILVGPSLNIQMIMAGAILAPFIALGAKEKKLLITSVVLNIIFMSAALIAFNISEPVDPLQGDSTWALQGLFFIIFLIVTLGYGFFAWTEMNELEENLDQEREKSTELLQNIIPQLEKAERKYRYLVEGTRDIIIALDEDLNIITANSAIHKVLGYKVDDKVGTNFLELMQFDEESHVMLGLLRANIGEMIKNKDSISFMGNFHHNHMAESTQLRVSLEYSETEGAVEILGKMTDVEDNIMLTFMDAENKTYTMDNGLNHAELLTQRITRNLAKFMDRQEAAQLRICLREIVINAIEHGNLAIDFEEKTAAMTNDRYFEFLRDRQLDKRFRDRKVHISYSLNPERVTYTITDEGDGFDHKKLLATSATRARDEMLGHGRGLAMTVEIFDSVEYNEKGNQVTLVKNFKS